jgi:ribosomal protein S18 acetylase RimI-like enzyme
MITRFADRSDLDLVFPLFDGYRQFYDQASDLTAAQAFLTDRLERKDSVIIIAVDGLQSVGFTQLFPTFSSVSLQSFYILNDLYVDPHFRNQKVGEKLLLHAQKFAASKELKGLALETAHDNRAYKLYEKLGWIKEDSFHHYFWSTNI